MSIRSALARAQRAAESRMVETCVIRRASTTTNGTTGALVRTYTIVYSGPCEVSDDGPGASRVESAAAPATVSRLVVKVPASTPGVRPGDEVVVDSRTFRVADSHVKTWQSAQRLPVEEVL